MDQLLSLDLALALQSQRDSYPNHYEGEEEEDEEGDRGEYHARPRGGSGVGGDEFDHLSSPDNTSGRIDKSARDGFSVHSGLQSGNSTPNVTARAALMNAALTKEGGTVIADASPRIPTSSPTPRVKRIAYNNVSHPYNREGHRNTHHRLSLFMPDIGGIGNLVMTARGTNINVQSTRAENIANMGASLNSIARACISSSTSPHNMMRVSEKYSIQPLHILIVDDR